MSRKRKTRRPSTSPAHDARALVARDRLFTFTDSDGTLHALPPASGGAEQVSFGDVMDAVTGGDSLAELRLGIATLTASGASSEALAALRAMPMPRATRILAKWMRRTGTGSPGESSR